MIRDIASPSCGLNRPLATVCAIASVASLRSLGVFKGGSRKRLFGILATGNKRSMHNRIAVGSDLSA